MIFLLLLLKVVSAIMPMPNLFVKGYLTVKINSKCSIKFSTVHEFPEHVD